MHLLLCLTALLCISHCRCTCTAEVRGVNDTWKRVIVKKHNELRARVANGREGDLPKAANMLEMVWDDLLAEKGQEWADKCELKHDSQADRDTGQGYTGQNIADRTNKRENPNWEMVIQGFYDEVADFDSNAIDKYFFQPEVSHFTEIIWAKTYKVGCGYARILKGQKYHHLYGCDYIPGGNIRNKPIYETGEPCSLCGGCGSTDGLCGIKISKFPKIVNNKDNLKTTNEIRKVSIKEDNLKTTNEILKSTIDEDNLKTTDEILKSSTDEENIDEYKTTKNAKKT